MCGLLCNARIKNGWLRLPSLSRSSSTAAVACVFVYLEPKKKNKRAKGSPTAEMRLASVSSDCRADRSCASESRIECSQRDLPCAFLHAY